jgi:hypothetical protein
MPVVVIALATRWSVFGRPDGREADGAGDAATMAAGAGCCDAIGFDRAGSSGVISIPAPGADAAGLCVGVDARVTGIAASDHVGTCETGTEAEAMA